MLYLVNSLAYLDFVSDRLWEFGFPLEVVSGLAKFPQFGSLDPRTAAANVNKKGWKKWLWIQEIYDKRKINHPKLWWLDRPVKKPLIKYYVWNTTVQIVTVKILLKFKKMTTGSVWYFVTLLQTGIFLEVLPSVNQFSN